MEETSIDDAGGAEYACQHSLKRFMCDQANPETDCRRALRICEWLGRFDGSVDDLVQLSPCDAWFILCSFDKYGITPDMDAPLLQNYWYAKESLEYQINPGDYTRRLRTHHGPNTR